MGGNRSAEPGLPLVIHADAPDLAAARRARQMARAARVGILRNPNSPPLPPRRKARLMGKWPDLQSSRRPAAAPPAGAGAMTITDTELTRRIMADDPAPAADADADADAPGAAEHPPPETPAPPRMPDDSAATPAERQRPLARNILLTGLLLLGMLTALGTIL